MEITRKLKGKTKTVDEIQVPGRGVTFLFFLPSDALQFYSFSIALWVFVFAGGTVGGRKPLYLIISDVLVLVPAPIVEDIKKAVKEEMN